MTGASLLRRDATCAGGGHLSICLSNYPEEAMYANVVPAEYAHDAEARRELDEQWARRVIAQLDVLREAIVQRFAPATCGNPDCSMCKSVEDILSREQAA